VGASGARPGAGGYRCESIDRPLDWRTLDFRAAKASAGFSHTLDLLGDGSVLVVSTPGHSLGHLSVVLRTASGPVLLAGDAAYTRRAIAEGHDQLARADFAAYHESLETLRRWAHINPDAPIICSHDYELWTNPPALYA
jgi:N-acyl homoserine lactone hydrolase